MHNWSKKYTDQIHIAKRIKTFIDLQTSTQNMIERIYVLALKQIEK